MPPRLNLPPKRCDECGQVFMRGRSASGRAEGPEDYNARRFCSQVCYFRWNHGANHYKYSGGLRRRGDGYVRLSDDRYLHRVVMERTIGRSLLPQEFVHHKDGNPSNNDPSNLELTTNSEHRKMHALEQERDNAGRFICGR